MRKLNTNDVFAALRLVSNTGLRARVKTLLENLKDMEDINLQSVGIDGILEIIAGVSSTGGQQMFYEFLSGPFECTEEQIGLMDLDELADNLTQLSQENDLGNFYRALSGLISKKR